MTTDDLIRALVADGYIGRKPRAVLLIALLLATAFVAILFFTRIGFREDIDAALRTVRFLVQIRRDRAASRSWPWAHCFAARDRSSRWAGGRDYCRFRCFCCPRALPQNCCQSRDRIGWSG